MGADILAEANASKFWTANLVKEIFMWRLLWSIEIILILFRRKQNKYSISHYKNLRIYFFSVTYEKVKNLAYEKYLN